MPRYVIIGLAVIVGTFIIMISLSWTTSSTVRKAAEFREKESRHINRRALRSRNSDTLENGNTNTSMNNNNTDEIERNDSNDSSEDDVDAVSQGCTNDIKKLLIEVSIIFLLISCYFAMVVTNWATEQRANGDTSAPNQGKVAMWLQTSAIMIAISLYIWSLIAPIIFPDRDFSGIGM